MKTDFQIAPESYLLLAIMLMILPFPWLISALLSATIHEAGHLLALKCLGIQVYSISIQPSGAKISSASLTSKQELIVSASGPAAGLIFLFSISSFPRLAICALVHSLFNLIPVYPFDGGRMLHAALTMLIKQERARKLACIITALIVAFFLIAAILLFRHSAILSAACILIALRFLRTKLPLDQSNTQ